jgi:glycosyltransferase involved in cell wall biosynthesis
MSPRATVVIPVYNRAHSVLPTLESVRVQTMTDFECVVVDDGSDDGEQLRVLVESLDDPRFRYVRRENGGGSAARNTGITEAKGAFVAFLDSDDRWLPTKLQRDAEAGAEKRVVFSPMIVERGGQLAGQRPSRGQQDGEAIGEYLTCAQGFVPTSTVAVPAALAKSVRYDEALSFGDDSDFALRLAAATDGIFHFHGDALSIMADDETGDRLSRVVNWHAVLAWLERTRPLLSDRAYLAYRGWHVARMAADAGQYRKALHFYVAALIKGAFAPSLAAKALVQIAVRRTVYSRFRRLRRRQTISYLEDLHPPA